MRDPLPLWSALCQSVAMVNRGLPRWLSKQGATMAEWLDRAVRNQANLEAGERVLPPAPRPSGLPALRPDTRTQTDMGGLADLMRANVTMTCLARAAVARDTAK